MTDGSPTTRWSPSDTRYAAATALLGLIARFAYVGFLEVPPYDPWRHLQLLDNLRSGLGFTLFDGQPYLWYSPVWHVLLATLPEFLRPEWVAAVFSTLAVPLLYGFLRTAESHRVAIVGAFILALCGPVVRFTCHYGPEAFALCLTLAALWLFRARLHLVWAACAGLLYGIALIARMNFLFIAPLFMPGLLSTRRGVAFGIGAIVPLALTWWRNHTIISTHDWVFTWDGLATRSADFNPLSTLIVQLHPAVSEGLHRLHDIIVPVPEWTRSWWLIVFVSLGALAGLAARRLWLALTIAGTMFYFLVLDSGMSSNFFRIYLVLLPAFIYGVALATERLVRSPASGAAIAAVFILAGAPMFQPAQMIPISMTAPPPGLIDDELYLVNSGFFHPECLMRQFPEARFVGLPIDADQLEAFLADYPQARRVLWHSFSVQDEVRDALLGRAGTTVVGTGKNDFNRRYSVLALDDSSESQAP